MPYLDAVVRQTGVQQLLTSSGELRRRPAGQQVAVQVELRLCIHHKKQSDTTSWY